jgi:hypothetical protein
MSILLGCQINLTLTNEAMKAATLAKVVIRLREEIVQGEPDRKENRA